MFETTVYRLCHITLYNANSLKIPRNSVSLLVLFKVKTFRFKNKNRSHIFHAKGQLLLYVARRHDCFVLKKSVTVISLN